MDIKIEMVNPDDNEQRISIKKQEPKPSAKAEREKKAIEKKHLSRLKREPKQVGVDNIGTIEPCIYARYKDGVFQAYDVAITLQRVTTYDKEKKEFVKHKETKKKSFNNWEDAIDFRDGVKVEKKKLKKIGKQMSGHYYTVAEVIDIFEDDLRKKGKDEDYIAEKIRYGEHAKKYFTQANGDRHLVAALEKGDIQDYLHFLRYNHKSSGELYAIKSLEKERAYIHQLWDFMLDRPVRYGITRNIADGAKLPEIEKDENGEPIESEYSARLLTYIQLEELIKEACKFDDPSFLFLVVFSLCQGLRRGEICGLKYGDIDFKKKRITIQHNRIQSVASGRNKVKKPKTNRIREIELHKIGYKTLMLYKEWQEAILGHSIDPEDFVLRYEVNLRYDYLPHTGKISRKWKETCDKINKEREKNKLEIIPYGRLHDGRHVYASLLLNGVKKEDGSIIRPASYIQIYESMGHKLPKQLQNTTTQVYRGDTGERFTVTAFWDELIDFDVLTEWNKYKQTRDNMSELQKAVYAERKRKRMEKAYREKMNAKKEPEEVIIEYTVDAPLSSFEEDDI